MLILWQWVVLHLMVAAVGTWLLRRYALWRRLLDLPCERRSHQVATPRGGGMAIVFALLFGCVLAWFGLPQWRFHLVLYACGFTLIASIGWWDDHRPIPAVIRFVVHCLAATLLGVLTFTASGTLWQALLAAAAALVLVNIWNFMDGINGLATTQAAVAAIAYALLLPGLVAWAAWALAAACLGFLPFNFPRARIFLGDGGSGALGYALAGLMVLVLIKAQISVWIVWIPLTAFLVDAGLTLLSRVFSGQCWWRPHVQHVYQRAARRCGSHTPVTLTYFVFSVFTLVLFFAVTHLSLLKWEAMQSMIFCIFSCLIWLFLRHELRDD
ncbi:lipopolysaccharide biosynthesis protein [Xylella fastidiosa]|uniref:Lipopolysaccharide biosynthesis protein n=2 Tax=Xylella fastidiosa TaxID=2371 RepID=A0ABC8AC75_XYLFS|nr:LPS biosynthesis protein [Xylella fastidiosa]AAF85233.1 lipopolysaccharide core biosynthesis protein [Xylella fastidiosa 9a5c]ALQ95495.1 lipopolysaccharide biosynthesis protein [Xylella fastidiosa]ALQ96492.1 lipopolysaccharide biosynthesis protein [Xylella fastidiosa]ALR03760.1 lipopolysaccharide biosynthesis protein [Xylella fastidiosa]ALR05982.1 lipopolysaccharide biosynthesis protein [Xylella fastidiosa]